jgi:hypothetical protein
LHELEGLPGDVAVSWSCLIVDCLDHLCGISDAVVLFLNPAAGGSKILGVHVHHMLFGILFMCLGGVPAVLLRSEDRLKFLAVCVFGVGLGLALDEWILFVLRETAPNTPYLSPLSLAGAFVLVALACGYTAFVWRFLVNRQASSSNPEKKEGETQ